MYAIRSYYGARKNLPRKGKVFTLFTDRNAFWNGQHVRRYPQASVCRCKTDGTRITSYNVCYTKLLRNRVFAGFFFWCVFCFDAAVRLSDSERDSAAHRAHHHAFHDGLTANRASFHLLFPLISIYAIRNEIFTVASCMFGSFYHTRHRRARKNLPRNRITSYNVCYTKLLRTEQYYHIF